MSAGYGSRADIRKRLAEQHEANRAATWKERYEELAGELVETRAALGGAIDHAEARDRQLADLRERVQRLADEMRMYASPFGVAVTYSERVAALLTEGAES